MKRRFRRGVELADRAFHEQPWEHGQLELYSGVLYLSAQGRFHNPPPTGVLYRPALKACFSNTVSFAGVEQDGKAWHAQVWFCEIWHHTAPHLA